MISPSVSRLRTRLSSARAAETSDLNALKLKGIDLACEQLGARSLADLGAAWGVEGGYAFYAARTWSLERVVIVDEDLRRYPTLLDKATHTDAVDLVDGNFGEESVAEAVGTVDVVTMFDVLLHQAAPSSWQSVLAMYAPRTRLFVLAGPWWTRDNTVRLTDLSRAEYLRIVPDLPVHTNLYDKIDEINPQRNLPWRDCHDVWQWGISDRDLRQVMKTLGFELVHFERHGAWPYRDAAGQPRDLQEFFNGLYLFSRQGAA